MKTITKSGMAFLIAVLLIISCKKDSFMGNLTWYEFRDAYLNTDQTITQDATGAFTITGAQGTQISFPAGAFVDFLDSTITITGNIDLTLQEINSRKDLVLNGDKVGYLGGGQWICGGGVQDLLASQGSAAIKIKSTLPTPSIGVTLPSSTGAGSGLSVYYWDAGLIWVNGGAATGTSTYVFPIEKKVVSGLFSMTYNCAKPDVAANATITVNVTYEDAGYNPNPPTNDQITVVKVIYKDAPSVVFLGGFDYITNSVTGPVTSGRSAVIVGYSGGPIPSTGTSTDLFFAAKTVTLTGGATYTLDMKRIDQASLDAILAGI